MSTFQLLIDSLYRELLFTSVILLIILLFNNLVLYRQKLTSHFSMMLLCGAVMCVFELLWDVFDDHTAMTLQYTNAGHCHPILQRRGEPCAILKKKYGMFLAGMDDTEYR